MKVKCHQLCLTSDVAEKKSWEQI